jgi:hypothetical protein
MSLPGVRGNFPAEYFLNADEIAQEKITLLKNKLALSPIKKINSVYEPVALFYQTQLFGKYVDGGFLVNEARSQKGTFFTISLFVICILMLLIFPGNRKFCGLQLKIALPVFLVVAGCFGMMMELVLIALFQSSAGYIYSAIAFISALFMLGFAIGSLLAGKISRAPTSLRLLLLMELLKIGLLLFMMCNPVLLLKSKALIYSLVALCGGLTAFCYVLFLKLVAEAFASEKTFLGKLPAIANFADLAGAAIGALSFSAVLLPLFGMRGIYIILMVLEMFATLPIVIFLWHRFFHRVAINSSQHSVNP